MTIDRPLPRQYSALRRLWQEAFGDDAVYLGRFWETAFSADRCRCVSVNGTPVAALYWFDCEYEGQQTAYIYAVATAAACRGQGHFHRLLDNTHRHLSASGYAAALTYPATETLRPLYEGMGYRTAGQCGTVTCQAGDRPAEFCPLTVEQYAAARRRLLPAGAVIQEGATLSALSIGAGLYGGTDWVLAAHRSEDRLIGAEYLGDPALLPGIVRAFDCMSGRFRVPAGDRWAIMFHPLTERAVPPAYFGLVLD